MPYPKHANIQHLEFLCPFFALGILTRDFAYARLKGRIALCAALVYLVVFHFFSFDVSLYTMRLVTSEVEHFYGTLIRLAGGVSGIILSLYFIKCLMRIGEQRLKWLAVLGTLTLPIYAIHQKFYEVNRLLHIHSTNLLVFLLGTIIVILLSITAYKLLSKNCYLALLLFGKSRK